MSFWLELPMELRYMILDYLDNETKMNFGSCSLKSFECFLNYLSNIDSIFILNGIIEKIRMKQRKADISFKVRENSITCALGSSKFQIEHSTMTKILDDFQGKILKKSNFSILTIRGDVNVDNFQSLHNLKTLNLEDCDEDTALFFINKAENLKNLFLLPNKNSENGIANCQKIFNIEQAEIYGVQFNDDQFLQFESSKLFIENGYITENGINAFIENWSKSENKQGFVYFMIDGRNITMPNWIGSEEFVEQRSDGSYLIKNRSNGSLGVYSQNGSNGVMFRIMG